MKDSREHQKWHVKQAQTKLPRRESAHNFLKRTDQLASNQLNAQIKKTYKFECHPRAQAKVFITNLLNIDFSFRANLGVVEQFESYWWSEISLKGRRNVNFPCDNNVICRPLL